MESNPPQYILRPLRWDEAEGTAQDLVNQLTNKNSLIDFIALKAAMESFLAANEFSELDLGHSFLNAHLVGSTSTSTWDVYEEGVKETIRQISHELFSD